MDDAHAATLPDDPQALKALCERAMREIAALAAERDALVADRERIVAESERQIAQLMSQLDKLKRQVWGQRADRLRSAAEIGQMIFEFAAEMQAMGIDPGTLSPQDAAEQRDPAQRRRVAAKRRGAGRMDIASMHHLRKIECRHELSDAQRGCPGCDVARTLIGWEESWVIERIPATFVRIHHLRAKYACSGCDAAGNGGQVEVAPKPADASPVEKGMAGPGLIAWIVTSRCADYLPIYRVRDILARSGLEIARSTMHLWCADVARIVEPLYVRMCDRVRSAHLIATDDTPMPMQAKGRCKRARVWVYCGDAAHPYNVFEFTPNRARDGPLRFFRDHEPIEGQTLLADAYSGYNEVVVGNGFVRAGCWAHARRKFTDAQESEPRVATAMVDLIGRMYAIEGRISKADAGARAEARATESRAVLDEIHAKLLEWKAALLPRCEMGGAVNYVLNQWATLTVFAGDQAVPIDNNFAEREMKRQAITRKNSLFVASPEGGRVAAILASIVSSCRRHDANPELFLTQYFVNRPANDPQELDEWMPDRWAARQAKIAAECE